MDGLSMHRAHLSGPFFYSAALESFVAFIEETELDEDSMKAVFEFLFKAPSVIVDHAVLIIWDLPVGTSSPKLSKEKRDFIQDFILDEVTIRQFYQLVGEANVRLIDQKLMKTTLIVYQYPNALPDLYNWAADLKIHLCNTGLDCCDASYVAVKKNKRGQSERILATTIEELDKTIGMIDASKAKLVMWGAFKPQDLLCISNKMITEDTKDGL